LGEGGESGGWRGDCKSGGGPGVSGKWRGGGWTSATAERSTLVRGEECVG